MKDIKAKDITICLVGNPNCGKTTFFNALTDGKQRVGNWPGVTVECKTGTYIYAKSQVNVVDLPGVYSLSSVADSTAIDTQIACDYIASAQADIIINIIDANNLERNLYLTSQLVEIGTPLIVVVSMQDVAAKRGIKIDITELARALGCPVISLNSYQKGVQQFKELLTAKKLRSHAQNSHNAAVTPHYPPLLQEKIEQLSEQIRQALPQHTAMASWLALRLLEGDNQANVLVNETIATSCQQAKQEIEMGLAEEADILLADARYGYAHQITQTVTQVKSQKTKHITSLLDKMVLNRILGIPIFLAVMYLLFLLAINVGGLFQDFFDIVGDAIFVQGFAQLLQTLSFPAWLITILTDGLGKGINTTLTFIPVLAGMFFFLALLEDSGYMARASFVMDRFMRALGLPGKSFVPLLIGFGCNVPAIMAARTLEYKRDRMLTVMMAPFMSCGARLAIFAVFAAIFFPSGGQNIVFGLYLLGVVIAVATGWLLRKTLLPGEPAPLVMELPPYHLPRLKNVMRQTWSRLRDFILRAGRFILPFCILIGALNIVHLSAMGGSESQSILAWLGQQITPIFAPMGLTEANWPATVGLLSGVLAKEVVIATLNTLYSQVGHIATAVAEPFSLLTNLQLAISSIWTNIQALPAAFSNPIVATAPGEQFSPGVTGEIKNHFVNGASVLAYLIFILLYVPCVSTIATIARELGARWAVFSTVWNTVLAYAIAVSFYQVATFNAHPLSSIVWVSGTVITLTLFFTLLRTYMKHVEGNAVAIYVANHRIQGCIR